MTEWMFVGISQINFEIVQLSSRDQPNHPASDFLRSFHRLIVPSSKLLAPFVESIAGLSQQGCVALNFFSGTLGIFVFLTKYIVLLLELVDPNALSGHEHLGLLEEDTKVTPLHHLAGVADPFDYSTHTKQLILAKQLVVYDANVNDLSGSEGRTPLHKAYALDVVTNLDFDVVTNLDFVEFLLDYSGLMLTNQFAPGAAKFLLNWPSTDVNITFLARVRETITLFSDRIALPDNPERYNPVEIKSQFLLQQWRGIENMLVERGL
jgi:hypothetical protein